MITRHDTITGMMGRATYIDLHAIMPGTDLRATLAAAVLHLPQAHPLWPTYLLSMIHLRDLPGMPPAKLHEPGRTHEVVLAALDPGAPFYPYDPNSWRILHPVNYVEQMTATDDVAEERFMALVDGLAGGALWPEPSDVPGARASFRRAVQDGLPHGNGHG